MKNASSEIDQSITTFSRSANIMRDAAEGSIKPHYSFSSSSIELLELVLDATTKNNADKAISVVGPYGSGKSMFGVLLTELCKNPESQWVRSALEGLNSIAPAIGDRVIESIKENTLDYKVIPIIGSRGSISVALINALADLCGDEGTSWISADFASRVSIAADQAKAGIIETSEIAKLYSETAVQSATAGNKGLIVLVDEFGQFLEHASSVESTDNLLLAQQLAEESSRAKNGSLILLTFLHQSVAHYSRSGGHEQFTEWQKVQGRFREVAFNEDPENQYELIRGAVSNLENSFNIEAWAKRVKKQSKLVPLFSQGPSGDYWDREIKRFAPLHPTTVFALPRLSAIVGQNQRTLFGFTDSSDPRGLRGIIGSSEFQPSVKSSITVDQLFDFFLRPASPVSIPDDARRRVAEANSALDRLGDRPTTLEARIIKALTVLSVVQPGTRLVCDIHTLAFALDISESSPDLKAALEQLISRKLVVFRKFSSEYKLWQGTDFDVDQAIRHISTELLNEESINSILDPYLKPRLVSARRHAFFTGTARTFGWIIAGTEEIMPQDYSIPVESESTDDGSVVLVLTENQNQIIKAQEWAAKQSDKNILILISTRPSDLSDQIKTLAASKRAESVYPVLGEDHVAKAEITARIEYHSEKIGELFDQLVYDRNSVNVFWSGKRRVEWEALPLTEVISQVCDQIYHSSPIIRNELVNRRDISPTGFSAVKKAVESVLNGTEEPRGGFEGHGAEVSIFRSLFEDTGLFRKSGGPQVRLMKNPPPDSNDSARLRPVWAHIAKWSESPESSPSGSEAPFVRLLNELMSPPFGIKRGLALILIWAFLMARRQEIALYDNGTYATDWDVEDFDRYMKHPEFYSVQWFSSQGSVAKAFARMSNAIPDQSASFGRDKNVSLAGLLGRLYGWYRRLPAYTTSTNSMSEKAIGLRLAIVSAVDPVDLVFDRIPEALGYPPISDRDRYPNKVIEEFASVISEISLTYNGLLHWITRQIYEVLEWGPEDEKIKNEFTSLSDSIMNRVSDSSMKSFVIRGKAEHSTRIKWLEAISAALTSQSSRFWNDHTKEEFQDKLKMMKVALNDAKRRAYAAEKNPEDRAVRVIVESGDDVLGDEIVSTQSVGQASLANAAIDRLFEDHDMADSEKQLNFLYQQIARKLNTIDR